jgi:hypothetical protein
MNLKHASLAAGLAAALCAPAFAQTSATASGSTTTVVTMPPATATVTVKPSTSVAVESSHLMPGGVMLPSTSTSVLGGPSGNISGSHSVTTSYWVNVPPNAAQRADFQRWQQLKP